MDAFDRLRRVPENLMLEQQDQHFDRAAEHFRRVIVAVQDTIYEMMGVVGALLVVVSLFNWDPRQGEVRIVLAAGVVLIIIAGIRWIVRSSSRSHVDPDEVL